MLRAAALGAVAGAAMVAARVIAHRLTQGMSGPPGTGPAAAPRTPSLRALETAPAAIAVLDRAARYVAASRRYVRDFQLPVSEPGELLGRSHGAVLPGFPAHWPELHRRVLAGESIVMEPERWVRADGTVEWARWEMAPWLQSDQSVGGVLLFAERITARRQIEAERARSEARLRQIWASSPSAMVLVAPDGRIEMVNAQAEHLFGYPPRELPGEPIERLVPEVFRAGHPELRAAMHAEAAARPMGEGREILGLRKDGTEVPVEIGLQPIDDGDRVLMLATVLDLTERREQAEALRSSEEQLRHAQKMQAIGTLTGGLAHDFNNLLGVIIGNLDLAHPLLTQHAAADELVREATEAALRGADLTARLLAFARRQPLHPQPVALNELVFETTQLLSRALGEQIRIALALQNDLWPVVVDRAQMEAALTNLATNARDAMPGGGSLRFATMNRSLDPGYAALHPEVTPGDYVVLEVTDNGTGMPPEVAAQVFEPFFTTKPAGGGTGLGLSMVFGFMKQSGGHVTVYSEVGLGSTFRLYLPRSAANGAKAGLPPHRADVPRGAGEMVLVVEDNPALRRVVVRQLLQLGYRVQPAADAAEAIGILQREPVAVLLTDIVMPGDMDGFGLARHVLTQWSSIAVVLTSGFPDARVERNLDTLPAPVRLLNKPYPVGVLAQVLHEALHGGLT
jgi:PAS domain S-box-containing protein